MLIIALLNDGTIMTLSVDRVLPSMTPDEWNLAEIFAYAIAYGLYLAVGTILLYVVIVYTTFFESRFGVEAYKEANDDHLRASCLSYSPGRMLTTTAQT